MEERRGFTLVEVLVVMAIIAILAGIAIPALRAARISGQVKATKATIERLKLAVEEYQRDFGDYPPSRPKEAGLDDNGLNGGAECLVRCLLTERKHGPYYEFEEGALANLDGDAVKGNPTGAALEAGDLFEYVDPWGNPFIYFHNKDYGEGARYLVGGKRVQCTPAKAETTGSYHGLRSFQLWSAGPNGENEDGGGDDVTSW